ncbi:ABC transporter substrate-binding protein [Roseomonas terrae]|jgi:peptide/nickel transport system substrate-binding protein|uniref:ABC transporter substrate-binding protein n=1 Tax=Neoroseomonas terrae TaxID=424799 RepID=A0ABS5ENH5_9PROT|nr:ABC transporter substrate-binding protein [Neoroseomonas terrae]MBR0652152.1 ABC transporter substrate-binding protein [Neoroseomonas terrae]
MSKGWTLCSAACLALFATAVAEADSLTMGMAGAVTSVDPHFHNASPNNSLAMQIFDRLVERDPEGRLIPGLAESWRPVSETVWEFKLRPGLTWHDGKPVTPDDIAFSYTRARNVPNSPGGFGGFLRSVASVSAVDATTLRIETPGPAPGLPGDLANVAVISRHVGEDATTADYNAGRAAIGSGAFRLRAFRPGERVELERNPAWQGGQVAWDVATYRMMPNAAARTAALLTGDVDIIEMPSASDLPRLTATPELRVVSAPGLRVIYLSPEVGTAVPAASVSAADGSPLPSNPLARREVRQALSIAINRSGLTERVLEGTATPTVQIVPRGTFSAVPDLTVGAADPERARALLASAGYPNGFRLTLHVPTDRYPGAPAVAQAIAQMWTRIGVRTSVASLPWSAYAAQRANFAIGVLGLGSATFDATSMLVNVLGTPDRTRNTGASNTTNYSNPALDTLVARAGATFEDAAREEMLRQATRMAMEDAAIIPLYHQTNTWAMQRRLTYQPRLDERSLAKDVRRAEP